MLEKSKSETLDLLNANFEKYFKDNKAYKYETRINLKLLSYGNNIKKNFLKFSEEFIFVAELGFDE